MLSPSTVKVAGHMARMLSDNEQVLTPVDGTPVAIMAAHYHVGAPELKRPLNYRGYQYLTDQFAKRNTPQGGDVVDPGSEQRDQLVELIAEGVKGMLFRVRNGVVPLCKKIHPAYVNRVKGSGLPDISIKALTYHAIHENDVLLSHVAEYPRKYKRETSYRSFILTMPSEEKMFEWLPQAATLADDVIREWMLEKVSESDLHEVWSGLFNMRAVSTEGMTFAARNKMPFNADQILTAYFLTSYLRDNPIDETPKGEQVSLAEWTAVMTSLHGMLGLKLIEMYEKRQQDRKMGKLVYQYDYNAGSDIFGAKLCVHTNGDLFEDWVDQGGDVQALLGAATHHANMLYIKPINEAHDSLVTLWKRKHEFLKGQATSSVSKARRVFLEDTLKTLGGDDNPNLPELSHDVLCERVRKGLLTISESELENDWRVIVKLVCLVYYPGSDYYPFLCAMERYGVGIDSREAATLAAVEVTAQWLAKQARMTSFVPKVAEQPTPVPAESADEESHA